MAKFRKKPVVIEAWRFDGSWECASPIISQSDCMAWSNRGEISIGTLEGTMIAVTGDWIIKGIIGEFYPCKPDIFAVLYEPAE